MPLAALGAEVDVGGEMIDDAVHETGGDVGLFERSVCTAT